MAISSKLFSTNKCQQTCHFKPNSQKSIEEISKIWLSFNVSQFKATSTMNT